MKKYKLGDLIEVTRGASLSGDFYAASGKYIRLTCGNFDYHNNCFKENTSKDNLYYTGEFRTEFLLDKGDLITPLTEQAIGLLGSTAWIPESGKYIQSQDIAKITCKEELLDKKFAYYLISSNMVKQQLSAAAQQTKIRHTSPDKIKDCTVWLPSLAEQKQIGQLLFDIDRKIEINRAINHNLEAMAKQLYDYWFVQFDFPDENGKPYKSSGGKMVWNEKLKREIPEDWKVAQLGNICSFRNGINYAKDEIGEPYAIVNVRNISATSILLDGEDFDVITIPLSKATNYILTEKDIVIARSGCPGSTRLLHTSNKTLFCGFIICCTPIEEYLRNYITLFLKILEGSSATTSGGSILQNVSQDTLKSLWIILPSIKLLMIFDRFLKDLIDLLYSNSMAIKILTKQRDELLPLLMNGQVKVGVERSRLNYDLIFLDSPIFSLL